MLKRYEDEDLPEFSQLRLRDINQKGNFGNLPIHVAAVRGAQDELDALIAAGADVNAAGELGNTPLHDATGQGHKHAVETLLNAGADLGAVNKEGKTALDVAEALGRSSIAGLLHTWSRTSGRRH